MRTGRTGRTAIAAVAVLVVLAGTASLVAGLVQGSSGGYLTTPAGAFGTSTAALLTDEIDVDSGQPADPVPDLGELGRVRVHVVSTDPTARLFVGIGDRDTVHGYLAGTAHDEFTSATHDPFRATFARLPGGDEMAPPAAQQFWVARAGGGADVVLEWDKTAGPWSLIVTNDDGRPGLDVRADIGLRFGFLTPLGAGLLVLGAALLAGARLTGRRAAAGRRSTAGRPPRRSRRSPVRSRTGPGSRR